VVREKPPQGKKKGGRSPKTRRAEEAVKQITDLDSLLKTFKIERWDYLLVGDGSCTGNWKYEAGFACVVVDRRNPETFETRHGMFDRGTNIVAEMMAYILPLLYLSATQPIRLRHVHILTDCEFLPKAWANPGWQQKSNSELWMLFKSLKRRGFQLHWHWMPRDTLDMNKFCHDLANAARVSGQHLAGRTLLKTPITTIDVNANQPEEPDAAVEQPADQ
jgi:ribonuclease HI